VAEVPVAGRSGYDGLIFSGLNPDRISAPPSSTRISSGSGSEEEYMSDIVLTKKGHRLVQLCERSGFKNVQELFLACLCDDLCPAICMECAAIGNTELTQRNGHCEKCGQPGMVSGLVLIAIF
jgi:hypothetical protein